MGGVPQGQKEKMNEETIKNIKRKLSELEEKVNNLNIQKFALSNINEELNKKTDTKLRNLLDGINLQEEISYINDWIGFHLKEVERCKAKLKKLEQVEEECIKGSFKIVFKEKPAIKEKVLNVKNRLNELRVKKPLIAYAIPFAVLLLAITSLFLFKPEITGYATLTKETSYSENLNLKINESGNYTWALSSQGQIRSIRATGSVEGNGTVKIYIEKDGKRYLIYKNK